MRKSAASNATPIRNGIVVRKFFLHVSKDEQKRRFLERIEKPEKNRLSSADVRKEVLAPAWRFTRYDPLTATPKFVVCGAANHGFTRAVVAAAVIETLPSNWPDVDKDKRKELAAAKQALLEEYGPHPFPATTSRARGASGPLRAR